MDADQIAGKSKKPLFIEVDGFRLPPTFYPDFFRAASKFEPEDGRVLVATYPKCGTTWTLQIVVLILRKGAPPSDTNEYFSLTPFMEMTSPNYLRDLPADACIKTHLPFDRITFSSGVRYIYVARHPADCVISFYHHVRYFPVYQFSDGSFDDFFEVFINGELDFGDYFDHVLSWYERRNEPNILFLTFEEMKKDHRGSVLKIAKHMGGGHLDAVLADNEAILKKILKYSSLEYMRQSTNKYWEEAFACLPSEQMQMQNPVLKNYAEQMAEAEKKGHASIGNFIRKGEVGEGRITLSKEQRQRLETRMREKFAGTEIVNWWQ